MRKIAGLCLALFLLGCSASLFAQDASKPDVGRVYVMVPKSGMVKQFEEGRKRHMEFHKKQNDTWSWLTWEIETGEGAGGYLSTTFGHTFADFDTWEAKLGAADAADSAANLAPYLTDNGDNGIWMVLKDISHSADGNMPSKMAQVNHFLLKPTREQDFADAAKKITEAINKTNWPPHYTWYMLVDGGQQPHYVLLIDMNGWADLAEPDPPFPAMLEKAMGRHDAEAVMHTVNECIQKEWTETILFRPDLSYMAPK